VKSNFWIHISHILVFIIPACTKKHVFITSMLFALLFCWHLQSQKSSPRPIVGQISLILGLTKASNSNLTFFHTLEYYYNVWKNFKFEFGAVSKPGIKLIVFFTLFQNFQFGAQKPPFWGKNISRPSKKHTVLVNWQILSEWYF